ncbi:MAG: flagellar biosynthetic protein FliO [Pseudomonadota bacterium]
MSGTSPSISFFLWFIAIVVMIPAVLWLLKRSPLGASLGGTSKTAPMRQVSSLALSPSQRVVTVEVGEGDERCWLVLGVTPQSITTLHSLSALDLPAAPLESTLSPDAFSQLLKRLRSGERREN